MASYCNVMNSFVISKGKILWPETVPVPAVTSNSESRLRRKSLLLHSPLQNERLNAHTHIPAIDSKVTMNFLRPKKDSNQQKNLPTPFKLGAYLFTNFEPKSA